MAALAPELSLDLRHQSRALERSNRADKQRKMSHTPLDKIQALDAIEKEIITCVQSAG